MRRPRPSSRSSSRKAVGVSGLVVTVDLFSALLDSRRGAAQALSEVASELGWPDVDPRAVFDRWDHENKGLHKEQASSASWSSFRELATEAMVRVSEQLRLPGDPVVGTAMLLDSIPRWPTWPDSIEGLRRLTEVAHVGILSNVDTDLLAGTAVIDHVDPDHLYTSERWRTYKPAERIYRLTQDAAASTGRAHLHVATSARDVQGAVAAGIHLIHLRRDGVPGPEDSVGVTTVSSLTDAADRVRERQDEREGRREDS